MTGGGSSPSNAAPSGSDTSRTALRVMYSGSGASGLPRGSPGMKVIGSTTVPASCRLRANCASVSSASTASARSWSKPGISTPEAR